MTVSVDPRPVTPDELRRAQFKNGMRGYDTAQVDEMLQRAAAIIELLIRDPQGATTSAQVAIRELRAADITDSFRGYNRNEVNDLCERAAATIETLRPADPEGIAQSLVRTDDDVAPDADAGAAAQAANRTTPSRDSDVRPAFIGSAVPPLRTTSPRESVRVSLGARTYHVVIGASLEIEVVNAVRSHGAQRVAIVTQAAIREHALVYQQALLEVGIDCLMLTIDDGEAAKSLATVERLCREMASWGLLRGDAVLAVGGGVVGDTAGFAASVYYRGVAIVQVPTTLLAMVDASIGGKTAVNLPQGKNLVGAFHQPIAVLADPTTLTTLSDRDFRCGLGEIAKYALMGDAQLRAIAEGESAALLARDPDVLRRAVARSAAVKARFVSADEHERTGLREHLNYGHTLAHAIETAAEHAFAHGEAVAVGLVFAGALAGALERISPAEDERHRAMCASLGLPTSLPEGLNPGDLITLMKRDKKAVGGLRFVLQGPNGLERVDDPDPLALDAAFAAVGVRA